MPKADPQEHAPLEFHKDPGASRSKWIAGALVLVVVGWMGSGFVIPAETETEAAASEPARGAIAVAVKQSTARPVTQYFLAEGQAEPDREARVRAETSGEIAEVVFEKGAQVTANQVLARIAPAERSAALNRAREELARARREFENANALLERGTATLDRVAEARADLASAEAAVAAAEEALDATAIRAPFAGRLEELAIDEGEYVQAGSEVARILDTDPLTVTLQVPQQALSRLEVGQTAEVSFITGETREGRIAFLGATADTGTRTFLAEIAVPNADGEIPAGVSAEVRIATGESVAHFLSPAILSLGPDGALGVKSVTEDDRVAFNEITIVRAQTDGIWVIGLPDEVRIITIGQGFVSAGEAVDPKSEEGLAERVSNASAPGDAAAMNAIIDAAFSRARVVALTLALILIAGAYAYVQIPKESSPEVPIPTIYVVTTLDGISPEDSERLMVEPLETELASITALKEIQARAGEGFASITLEFEPGFDADEALNKVREAVDRAKNELPDGATEPSVNEVNTALFPILTAILSGPVPERTLNRLAEELQDDLEAVEGILEVDLGGARDELLEVLIDPTVFETYDISFDELIGQINRNNRLIAAGAIETGAGRLVLKVPGLIEGVEDVMELPVKVRGDTVVTFADVATVRRSFEDPTSFARIDGQPALALEIKKRVGANIIETVADARAVIAESQGGWPDSVGITYLQDESEQVETILGDLEANVITAVILVMIVIVYALGVRSALLVGLAIPGAFLSGVAALWAMGYTMNIVVLFSLILVVGMLVDGAIVTTELADRKLQEGEAPAAAYAFAAKRMSWPIIASTATTLSVFFPLLFWDGVVGEFMKFLPITVILTLGASLFMALIFIPVIGGAIGRRQPQTAREKAALRAAEAGDPREIGGLTGGYVRLLQAAILNPGTTVLLAIAMLAGAFGLYGQYGYGVTFFPSVEPEFMQVQVRARDNFSIYERDALVRRVEERLFDYGEIQSVYARATADAQGDEEVIGTLQLELTEWDTRRTAAEIAAQIRREMEAIPGIDVQVQTQSGGPTAGKPVRLEIVSRDRDAQAEAVEIARARMEEIGGFTDVTDTRPLPGVEWRLRIDRSEAARFGADVSLLGQAVQLLTQGITVADYRPDDTDGSVDIRVRFPSEERTLEELESLRVPTSAGLVPISNFVSFDPSPRTGTIRRLDQRRVVTIEANVASGLLVNDQIEALRDALESASLPDSVDWSFAGEAEEQQDAMQFLSLAFATAIGLMFAVLLTQFNSFYQAFVVMSAIIFSVAGVLLGLLVTGRPFGVVMGGIGVIALAGIVVNNNIVLIDTFNDLRRSGQSPLEAALRTGAQRLRPVVLTSVTTALGLMPMVIGVNINFYTREIVYGAPSTQWWTELSSAIVGGLLVATVLTLVVTPAMLMLTTGRRQEAAPPARGAATAAAE